MDFHAGEVVQLKSGGPAMTVVNVDQQGVHCIWYAETDDAIRAAVVAGVALDAVHLADEEDEDDEHEHKPA